jgi:hypothetical protein
MARSTLALTALTSVHRNGLGDARSIEQEMTGSSGDGQYPAPTGLLQA